MSSLPLGPWPCGLGQIRKKFLAKMMQVPYSRSLIYISAALSRWPGNGTGHSCSRFVSWGGGSACSTSAINPSCCVGAFHFRRVPNTCFCVCSSNLVNLNLSNIPHSGYISPEAMSGSHSSPCVSSSLRLLWLASFFFLSHQSLPGWESRSLPPLKRSIDPPRSQIISFPLALPNI